VVVGLILAPTGAGGGILAVQLLVFGLGASVAEAGPVGLLAVGMAAALGALLGFRDGIVRYRAAVLVAASGVLLSPAGLWAARQASGKQAAAAKESAVCLRDGASGRFVWTRPCALAMALSGGLAGLLSGMLGGRRLAARLAGPRLQQGFAIVSALVAIAMVVRALS
jgi:uncharacterized membrane protein YfcA